ncbi:MAG: ArsR/SmtB family transcription factor, partial [Fimbriimonadaceae bacterium]
MSENLKSHILQVKNGSDAPVFKALGSELRLEILALLAGGDRNIAELQLALGVSQPTITKHVKILEKAGLILSEYMPGTQGLQKRCRLRVDRLMVSFEPTNVVEERTEEVTMPIGLYSRAQATPQCGLASREKMIGFLDTPQCFLDPNRAQAEILWMADGFVEYVFPNTLPASVDILRCELIMEACSEAPNYDHDYPSDITLWINGQEIGTWKCPGDFGAKRGLLNPDWWIDHMTEYGALKIWTI